MSATALLAAALALALVAASIGDIRARIIPNWLNGGIALAAPLWWWATGVSPWPGVAVQLGFSGLLLLVFSGAFAARAMGGGDVKLIAALGLWLPPLPGLRMLVVMALAGGALTLAMLAGRALRHRTGTLEVPYGVAIAFGALTILSERYLYQFG